MAYESILKRRRGTTARKDPADRFKKKDELGDLKKLATQYGVEVKEKGPSLFSKTMDILSRPLYASAGVSKALIRGENVASEALKGLTGQEKETYSEVLGELGVQGKWNKGVLGFVLDVALDPTTYFGGTLIKGGAKAVGKIARPLGKVASRIAPEQMGYIEAAGTNLKDAFGSAFKFGYGTTKGLADDVSRSLNKMGIEKENIIGGNIDAFGKRYTPKELDEAAQIMIDNRRKELKTRISGRIDEKGNKVLAGGKEGIVSSTKNGKIKVKFPDGTIKQFVSGSVKLAQDVSEAVFKKSKNEKVNILLDEFKKKASKIAKDAEIPESQVYENYFPFLKKNKLGQRGAPAVLEQSSKGYRKEFKDLIKDENLLKKPIEAYSRVEFQVARDNITKKTMDNMVGAYGKPKNAFKNADEALEAGFREVKDKKFGKVIGYLKEKDSKFINDYLFPEFKAVDLLAKASGYDQFTRAFKTMVTAYFPAFHVRNAMSGAVQNYQVVGSGAFNPKNYNNALAIMKGVNKEIKLGGKIYNTKELNKVFKENFQGASRFIADIGDDIEEVVGNTFKIRKVSKARQLGNMVEGTQKGAAMSEALRQGKTIEEAVELAERAGFDYSKITKFESKIMRRLVPFYTFARKNAGLQARTLVEHPERILNQKKFADMLSNSIGGNVTEEDLKGLPEWVLSGLGFKVEGNKYASQLGLPLEEFIERINYPMKSTLSSMNPILKYPLESKLGYDFFREQKLVDINKVAPASGQIYMDAKEKGKVPEWLDEVLNVREYKSGGKTKYSASPEALHFLRNIPTARLQGTLEKVFDEDLDKVNKFMAFFTGGRVYDIDQEQQRYFKSRDLKRDIEDELVGRGIGKQFETFYIPKEK